MSDFDSGDSGDAPELDTIQDAMRELDRRAEARKEEKRQARAKGKADGEEGDDPDDDKRRVSAEESEDEDDKPAKKAKAKATDDGADEGDDESDDDTEDEEDGKPKAKKRRASDDDDEDAEDGDSEEDADGDDDEAGREADAKPANVKLKVAGREVEVSPDDISQYVEALHRERGEMQEHVQRVNQWANGHAQQLSQQSQFLAQVAQQLIGKPPEQSLIQSAPQEFLAQREAHQQRLQLVQTLQAMNQQNSQRIAAAQQQALGQFRQRNVQALLVAMPDLADPAKLQAFQGRFTRVAQKYGFSPEEVGNMVDHRLYLMVRDLGRLADMEAAREASRKDVRNKLRAAKPLKAPESGASKLRPRDQQSASAKAAKKAFMRSGRTLRDAQRFIEHTAR